MGDAGRSIRAICLDIDGALIDGVLGPPFPGTLEAVERLRRCAPLRFVTNATSATPKALADHLGQLGLLTDERELLTPVSVAQRVLRAREHGRGLLLVDRDVAPIFDWFEHDPEGPAVLLATEGHELRIADLQPAFRRLLEGASFYTLQRNRYLRRFGVLMTDLGPIAAFLEYAAGVQAQTLGKPSPLLYDLVAGEIGVERSELLMVGDDAEFDVAASIELGLQAVLVKTGKYRTGDEKRVSPAPTAVLDSVAKLPEWLG